MVGTDYGNLGAKVFFIWGSLCTCCVVYGYFLIPETKGLSLEQIDTMMEECAPRHTPKWVPHATSQTEIKEGKESSFGSAEKAGYVEDVEKVTQS